MLRCQSFKIRALKLDTVEFQDFLFEKQKWLDGLQLHTISHHSFFNHVTHLHVMFLPYISILWGLYDSGPSVYNIHNYIFEIEYMFSLTLTNCDRSILLYCSF